MSDIDPTGYHHHGGGFWHKFGHWMLKITKWAVDAALLIVCEGPECAAAFNAAFNIVKDKIEGEGWAGSLLDGLCTFLSWEIAGEIGPEMDEEEQFERHVLVGLIQGVDSKAHGGSFASGFISGFNFNPYDNVFLKEGSAAGSVEWESKEELQEKLHHRVEKTIANQLGIPQPLVHAASELVMGDGSVGLPKFPTSLSKLPSLSIPSFPSIRPFDLIDSFPSLSGDISLSGLQSLSMSVANYLSVAIQQGPPEISAIVDVGFFRGTLPVDGIPEDLPFGLPGGSFSFSFSLSSFFYIFIFFFFFLFFFLFFPPPPSLLLIFPQQELPSWVDTSTSNSPLLVSLSKLIYLSHPVKLPGECLLVLTSGMLLFLLSKVEVGRCGVRVPLRANKTIINCFFFFFLIFLFFFLFCCFVVFFNKRSYFTKKKPKKYKKNNHKQVFSSLNLNILSLNETYLDTDVGHYFLFWIGAQF